MTDDVTKKFHFDQILPKCFSGKNNSIRKVEDLINSVQKVPENYVPLFATLDRDL